MQEYESLNLTVESDAESIETKKEWNKSVIEKVKTVFVIVTTLIFAYLLLSPAVEHTHLLRGVAYFFGAGAYISELCILTEGFKKHQSFHDMLMPYAFGIMYLAIGIDYLRG